MQEPHQPPGARIAPRHLSSVGAGFDCAVGNAVHDLSALEAQISLVVERSLERAVRTIKDFIVDDKTWQVRYLVVDTSHLWFGQSVLVARRWATRVDWFSKTVYVDLTRDAIKNSPKWDPSAPVNREYEAHLYDYYGRPVYWEAEEPVQGGVVLSPR